MSGQVILSVYVLTILSDLCSCSLCRIVALWRGENLSVSTVRELQRQTQRLFTVISQPSTLITVKEQEHGGSCRTKKRAETQDASLWVRLFPLQCSVQTKRTKRHSYRKTHWKVYLDSCNLKYSHFATSSLLYFSATMYSYTQVHKLQLECTLCPPQRFYICVSSRLAESALTASGEKVMMIRKLTRSWGRQRLNLNLSKPEPNRMNVNTCFHRS